MKDIDLCDNLLIELKVLHGYFNRIDLIFGNIISFDFLNQNNSTVFNQTKSSPYLGNLFNSFGALQASLILFPSSFKDFTLNMKINEIQNISDLINLRMNESEKLDQKLINLSNRIQKEYQISQKKYLTLLEIINKINSYHQQEEQRSLNSFKVRSKLQDIWPKYQKYLDDYLIQYNLINFLKIDFSKILENSIFEDHQFINFIQQTIINELFRSFSKRIRILSNYLKDAFNVAKSSLFTLDGEGDFQIFLSHSKICFQDFPPPIFQRHQFKNRHLSPSIISVPKYLFIYYPYGLFIANSNYESRNSNELTLIKDNYYFKMEDSIDNWILIMSIYGGLIGYSPLKYLNQIGTKIVVNKENQLFYVILEFLEDQNLYKCQDLKGNIFNFQKNI